MSRATQGSITRPPLPSGLVPRGGGPLAGNRRADRGGGVFTHPRPANRDPFSAARATRPNAREPHGSAPDLRAAIPAVRHAPETANRTPAPALVAASPTVLPPAAATPCPTAGAPGAGVATASGGAASGFAGPAALPARGEKVEGRR